MLSSSLCFGPSEGLEMKSLKMGQNPDGKRFVMKTTTSLLNGRNFA